MDFIKGTITFFNNQRGFGFITIPDGKQYFFHITHFTKGEQPILEGQVEFKVAPAVAVGKKPQAVQVRYRRQEFAQKLIDALAQEGGQGGGK